MTPIKLTDFVSVLVANKRANQFEIDSEVMFSDTYILKFLDVHLKFAIPDEIIKIFIIARRFRLSLVFIKKSKIQFNIDFFVNAIESNAYAIAFYLLRVYEDQIYKNYQKAIESLVKSF